MTSPDFILLIFASMLMLLGIIGSVAPALPGPPLSYFALLLAHFTQTIHFTNAFLVFWAVVVIVVAVLDYFIPIWGTKKFGGTKWGVWGSVLGMIIGLFIFPPLGVLTGSILGAFIGELIANGNDTKQALRAALGAFIGYVLSIGLKLAASGIMAFYFIKEIFIAYCN